MFQKAQLQEGGSTAYDKRRNKPLLHTHKKEVPFGFIFYCARDSVCVCVSIGGLCVSANLKPKYLEILVKYLSLLVFPEGIIQETKRTRSIGLELLQTKHQLRVRPLVCLVYSAEECSTTLPSPQILQ